MNIQINTDNHIGGSDELTRQVEDAVEGSLGWFGEWITRVEVHPSDESSSSKSRDNDKRCVMEARPAGHQPLSVSHQGSTMDQALNGSAKKLVWLLDDTKGSASRSQGKHLLCRLMDNPTRTPEEQQCDRSPRNI